MNQLQLKNAYTEDVIVVAPGSAIVSVPCVVYSITLTLDTAGDATVSIADATTYSSTSRVEKVVLTDEVSTIQLVYPYGKKFTTGLVAISNLGSVDISVTYE